MMLLNKYQVSMPYGFRQEKFSMFFRIKAYVKYVTPGEGPLLPEGHNFNKLGRGRLGDDTYQLSRL